MTRAWSRARTRVGAGAVVLTCGLVVLVGCGDEGSDGAEQPEGSVTASDSSGPSETPSDGPSDSPTPGEDVPSASPSQEPRTDPACDSVWVEGKRFTTPYKGCFNGERWVKARPFYCSFGGKLVTYDQQFWATPGKPVRHAPGGLGKDPDYQQALGACTA
jgi:hypothetical protein